MIANRISIQKETEVATALQARDYKGFGSGFQGQNAVMSLTQSDAVEETQQIRPTVGI